MSPEAKEWSEGTKGKSKKCRKGSWEVGPLPAPGI